MIKRRLKDLKNGEAIAIKIKKGKYKNKYLILICCKESPEEERDFYFRAKLSKKLPITAEEVNKLPFIKVGVIHFIERYFPASGVETYEELEKRKRHYVYYPDKYNYLYMYYFILVFKKGDNLNDIIYLNIQGVERPADEYVNDRKLSNSEMMLFSELETSLINCYEDYNKRKSYIYTKWGQEQYKRSAIESVVAKKCCDKMMQEKKISNHNSQNTQ